MPKIGIIIDRIKATEASKAPHKADWMLNVAFYHGNQWIRWGDATGRFVPLRVPRENEWRTQLTANYFQPIANTMASKLTQNRPPILVEPAHYDYSNNAMARAAQRILDYSYDKLRIRHETHKAAKWMVLTGSGWWGLYWDHNSGDRQIVDGKVQYAGEPRIDCISPMDIGIDPMAERPEHAEWAYRKRYWSKESVKQFLNKDVEADLPTRDDPDDIESDRAQSDAIQDAEIYGNLNKSYVTVYEFYDLVEQKLYWLTKDKILKSQDWTLGMPFIGFVMDDNMGDIRNGRITNGQVWGKTPMTHCRALQVELNKTISQIVDTKNMTAMPRLIANKSANIIGNTYETSPGAVVLWSGTGREPHVLDTGTLPGYMLQIPNDTIQRMYDITGVHEVAMGKAPGSVQSGRAVALLDEAAATRFNYPALNITDALQRAMMLVLRLWHQYGDVPFLSRVVGPDMDLGLTEFMAAGPSAVNIRVVEGSTLAQSKTMRRNDIKEAWSIGLLDDPKEVRKMLEFDVGDVINGDYDQDRIAQKREIAKILSGGKAEIHQWDNHFVHRDEIEAVLKSPDFEDYEPSVKEALVNHWNGHNEAIRAVEMAQQQAAMQRGVASAGAPKSETFSQTNVEQAPSMEAAGVSRMTGMGQNAEGGAGVLGIPAIGV